MWRLLFGCDFYANTTCLVLSFSIILAAHRQSGCRVRHQPIYIDFHETYSYLCHNFILIFASTELLVRIIRMVRSYSHKVTSRRNKELKENINQISTNFLVFVCMYVCIYKTFQFPSYSLGWRYGGESQKKPLKAQTIFSPCNATCHCLPFQTRNPFLLL